jgi:hypothetical protein
MSRPVRIILAAAACLVIAAGAYLFAIGQMDSLFAYRSPISANPPAPLPPANDPLTRRVVFVLVDALREDTSLKAEVMPFLAGLRADGAWATMHSQPPSYSQPGYSVLLTGAWPELSDGPAMNVDTAGIWTFTQDDLFSAAHRQGIQTAVSAYVWFEKLIPIDAVDASFYTLGEDAQADRDVMDAALPWLESAQYGLVLIHLDQVDYAGHHEGGPQDPRWDEAAARADTLIQEVASHLDLTQDTLLVASDHGQIDIGGHGGQDPITLLEPFVLAGKGVKPGEYGDIRMVDLAPTLAVLLGANLPASAQGHPLTEMLDLSGDQAASVQAAYEQQQLDLYQKFQAVAGTGSGPTEAIRTDLGAVEKEMDSIRDAQLSKERPLRILLAVIAALIPALLFFRNTKSRHELDRRLWLLGGALAMILLFHLRYALLDRNTYSMSSVISANWLVMYAAVTASIAFLIVWLAITLLRRMFRLSPGHAAEFSLDMGLVAVYLLALPALIGFAVNGFSVTWALPEFNTWYLGFFSLVQILMFAAITPLMAGLSALVSFAGPERSKRRRQTPIKSSTD